MKWLHDRASIALTEFLLLTVNYDRISNHRGRRGSQRFAEVEEGRGGISIRKARKREGGAEIFETDDISPAHFVFS